MRLLASSLLLVVFSGCSSADDTASGDTTDTGSASDSTSSSDTSTDDSTTPKDSNGEDSTTSDGSGSDSLTVDSASTDSATADSAKTDSSVADSGASTDALVDAGDECLSEADCAIYSWQCNVDPPDCDCRAIRKTSTPPMCPAGHSVSCFIDPCSMKKATCVSGKCVVAPKA